MIMYSSTESAIYLEYDSLDYIMTIVKGFGLGVIYNQLYSIYSDIIHIRMYRAL